MNKTQPKELFGIHTQHDVQTLNSSDKKDTRHNSLPEFRSLTTQQELSVQTQTVVHTLTATNTRNKRTAGRQSTRGRNVTWCLPEPQGFRPQFRATNPQTEGGGAQSPRISARWQHHPVQHP
jgi:hypothetical protein